MKKVLILEVLWKRSEKPLSCEITVIVETGKEAQDHVGQRKIETYRRQQGGKTQQGKTEIWGAGQVFD